MIELLDVVIIFVDGTSICVCNYLTLRMMLIWTFSSGVQVFIFWRFFYLENVQMQQLRKGLLKGFASAGTQKVDLRALSSSQREELFKVRQMIIRRVQTLLVTLHQYFRRNVRTIDYIHSINRQVWCKASACFMLTQVCCFLEVFSGNIDFSVP